MKHNRSVILSLSILALCRGDAALAQGAASTGTAPVAPAPVAPPTAAPAESVVTVVRLDGVDYDAKLRPEYLVGDPVLVPIEVSNPGESSIEAPDLTARPWLIRFEQVGADGSRVRRSTAPPESDGGRTVRIAVRGHRRTLLEIPGLQGISAGSYELGVQLVTSDAQGKQQTTELARQSVRFSEPRPVAGDLGAAALAGTKVGLRSAWVHQAHDGYDLYLHQVTGSDPTARGTDRFLRHLTASVQPWIAAARSTEAGAPAVVWLDGGRSLHVLRVDTTGLTQTDRTVDAPWPSVDVAGRPAVAAGGAVAVPVWVPDPAGASGELRVGVVGPGSASGFAKLSRFDHRPTDVQTTVDASGGVQFLVRHDAGVDLYSLPVNVTAASELLPLAGRRLQASTGTTATGTTIDAQFGVLRSVEEQAGGLAVLVTTQVGATVSGQWLDLRGTALSPTATLTIPPGSRVVAVLSGQQELGVLTQEARGLTWRQGAVTQSVSGSPSDLQLVRDATQQAVLRRFSRGAPVHAERLRTAATVTEAPAATEGQAPEAKTTTP